VEQKYPNYKKI